MFAKRNSLIPLKLILAIIAILLVFGMVVQAAVAPSVQQRPKPPIVHLPIDKQLVLNADVSVDWVRLNKAIGDGDPVGQSVFNISIKNSGPVDVPAFKVRMSLAALSGGPAPAELSGTKDCPALAKGASYSFIWPNPSSTGWNSGSYRLTVEADSDKTLKDADRQNNVKTLDFTVLPAQTVKIVGNAGNPVLADVTAFSGATAVQTHTTNAQGIAYFPGLAAGRYIFFVVPKNPGYDQANVNATVPQSMITITLTGQKSQVMIGVKDTKSNPIAGATVATTVGGAARTLTTDANGGALFDNLLPGMILTFTASKDGYVRNTIQVTVPPVGTAQGVIKLSGTPGDASITVTEGTTLMSGVTVKARGYDGMEVSQVTNSQGVATFTGLPPQHYVFSVTKTGYSPAYVDMFVITNTKVAGTITMSRKLGDASILVLDAANTYSPIAGATVSVTVAGAVRQIVTDAGGIALFTGLPTGDYSFAAAADGYSGNTLTATVQEGRGSYNDKRINLSRTTGSITVTVTDGRSPLAGVYVTGKLKEPLAGHPETGALRSATTNSQGVAVLSNLYFGQNDVTVHKTDYTGAGATVNIAGTATVPLTLTMVHDTGSVDVNVRDDKNQLLAGASVAITSGDATQTQTTGANGVASFTNLPVGPYTFTASLAGFNTGTATVTVSKSVKQTPAITLTRKTTGATVTVTDGASPLTGAVVTVSAPGVGSTSQQTGADGKAAFTSLLPGQYTTSASKQNYGTNTGNLTVALDGTAEITIALTRDTGGVDIYVRDNNSAIIPGATVTASGGGPSLTQTTNDNGVAGFSGLITGNWTFTVAKAGYNSGTVTVNIEKNVRQGPVVLLAKESGSATFTVTDGANPVVDAKVLLVGLNGSSISRQTDASGKTTFTGLAPGQYGATASKSGYSDSARAIVTVAVNATAAATLTVTRQQTPAATQYVSVINAFGDPISGATVTFAGDLVTKTQTTGADGKATFSGLTIGSYVITVVKDGYNTFTANQYQATATGGIFQVKLTQ